MCLAFFCNPEPAFGQGARGRETVRASGQGKGPGGQGQGSGGQGQGPGGQGQRQGGSGAQDEGGSCRQSEKERDKICRRESEGADGTQILGAPSSRVAKTQYNIFHPTLVPPHTKE